MQEIQLAKEINRLIQLCKYSNKGDDEVTVRTGEYSRILRAGLRDDAAVSAVVDDLVDHCEEIPTPAEMHAAIRRYNEDSLERRTQRAQESERANWAKVYGPPVPFEGNPVNCLCGKPCNQIMAQIRNNHSEIAAMIKSGKLKGIPRRVYQPYRDSTVQENESDFALAKRLLALTWHSDECTAR